MEWLKCFAESRLCNKNTRVLLPLRHSVFKRKGQDLAFTNAVDCHLDLFFSVQKPAEGKKKGHLHCRTEFSVKPETQESTLDNEHVYTCM